MSAKSPSRPISTRSIDTHGTVFLIVDRSIEGATGERSSTCLALRSLVADSAQIHAEWNRTRVIPVSASSIEIANAPLGQSTENSVTVFSRHPPYC